MNTHFKHAACFESFKIVAVFLKRKKRCAEKRETRQKEIRHARSESSEPAAEPQGPHGRRRVAASEHEKNELGALLQKWHKKDGQLVSAQSTAKEVELALGPRVKRHPGPEALAEGAAVFSNLT